MWHNLWTFPKIGNPLLFKIQNLHSPSNRFRFECKLNAVTLVFVQITVFILLFTLVLERNDNETDEDVDHEESYDDDVDNVVGGDNWSEIVDGPVVFGIWIDWIVKQSRPAFKCCDGEECQHGFGDIIVMETFVRPNAIFNVRFVDVTIREYQVCSMAFLSCLFWSIWTFVEFSLRVFNKILAFVFRLCTTK